MDEWKLGYLAGMVDAECYIGIQRGIGGKRRTPSYTIRFELAMVDIKPIEFVNSLLPSSKIIHQQSNGRRQQYYRLRVVQQEAISLLKSVLPYVQGKQRQIEICLEVDALRRKYSPSRRHIGSQHAFPMPPEFEEQVYPLFLEFRSLKLKGRGHRCE